MDTLSHYAEALPAYSTAMASGRRIVQHTAIIASDAAGEADARRAIDHRRELVEKLSQASSNLRASIKEWDDLDGGNDEMRDAGDDLAGRALYVVELLKELGY